MHDPSAHGDPRAIVELLETARDSHDLDAMLACFHEDFRSDQPLDPSLSFVGREHVRSRWASNFERIPNLRAELLAAVSDGDSLWAEHRWHGTRVDGTRWDVRGVIIWRLREGRIASARLYIGDVGGTTPRGEPPPPGS